MGKSFVFLWLLCLEFSLNRNSNIILEGWLWKQGNRVRTWKRRWFILTDGCLCYYESRTVD